MREHNEKFNEAHKLYMEGKLKDSFEKYLFLSKCGYIDCQVFVGWMYFSGEGIEKNYDIARFWYEKAVSAGDSEALFLLGKLDFMQDKYELAFSRFEESASKGYFPALYRLGKMYKLGKGVKCNHTKAYELFCRAAECGHLFSKKEQALYLLSGNYGLLNRLRGIWVYTILLFQAIRIGSTDPHSEFIRT